MNKFELAEAYKQLTSTFGMNHKQRDAFDLSPDYLAILQLVHDRKWTTVEVKMNENNYFMTDGPKVVNIDGPNYGSIQM